MSRRLFSEIRPKMVEKQFGVKFTKPPPREKQDKNESELHVSSNKRASKLGPNFINASRFAAAFVNLAN